jgi:NADH-quinone oxidoreductase subunit N
MLAPILAQTTAAPVFHGPKFDWFSLSPILVLLGGGLLLMLLTALAPKAWPKGFSAFITACTAGAAAVLSIVLWHHVADRGPVSLVGGALSLDNFSVFLFLVICVAVFLTALICDDYLRREDMDGAELYALMMMAAIGAMVMAASSDLVVLFIGLETLSIALYVMAASHLRRIESQESGIKYFVLGGFSSAFFLYGIAMVYGATGSTRMGAIRSFLAANVLLDKGMLVAGFALLLVGLGFKVAAAPFHSWTPDVYQGAPTPVTGFMASAAKAAGFAALLRVFVVMFAGYTTDWRPVVFVLAILTLVVGAVLAVVQRNVKRMLAYSSISHAGFILVGVQAATKRGTAGSLFYLLAYAVMVLGTFGVVTLVTRTGDADHSLETFRGLSRRRPVLALVFTVLLLSQAGVPFTSGFWAKAGVIAAAVDAHSYALAIVAMLAAVVAAFLYLRIIVSMYLVDPEPADATRGPVRVPIGAGLALVLAVGFTIGVGVLPSFFVTLSEHAVPALAGG